MSIKDIMKITKLITAGALSLFATLANSATVLVPTNSDVNFLVSQPFVETHGFELAVFDESAVTSINVSNEITDTSSIINLTLDGPFQGINGPTYQGLLSLNYNFIMGLSADSGTTWIADSGSSFGVNTALIEFNVSGVNEALVIDVAPVPVPAAVWLFGSGLIGLAGIARRKKA